MRCAEPGKAEFSEGSELSRAVACEFIGGKDRALQLAGQFLDAGENLLAEPYSAGELKKDFLDPTSATVGVEFVGTSISTDAGWSMG